MCALVYMRGNYKLSLNQDQESFFKIIVDGVHTKVYSLKQRAETLLKTRSITMAKIQAPFLSLGATGQVAKTLVASTWKGIKTMRHYVKPANPRSTAQVAQRTIMTSIVAFWHDNAVTEAITTAWNKLALVSGKPQSGFNAFTSSQVNLTVGLSRPSLLSAPACALAGTITGVSAFGGDPVLEFPQEWKLYVGSTEGKLFERDAVINIGEETWEIVYTPVAGDAFFKVTGATQAEDAYYDVSGIYAVPAVV